MSAKKRKNLAAKPAAEALAPARPAAAGELPGSAGPAPKVWWLSGAALAACGYYFLTKADAAGQNAWAWAAPACLLAGYLLFIPAIISSSRR